MAKLRRESAKQFWARVEEEGRLAQVEEMRDTLLAGGCSKRLVQATLVEGYQPLDGPRVRAWPTPDSWACGRVDGKRPPPSKQERLERDVLWVHANLDRSVEEAPSNGARLLLKMAQERPNEFMRVYIKCVPSIDRRERERIEARRSKVKKRRDAKRRRIAAEKRAADWEAARQREEQERAAAEAEAERRAEAEKQEQERLRIAEAQSRESMNGKHQSAASPKGKKRKTQKSAAIAPVQTDEHQPSTPSQAALPPAELAASPGLAETPAPSASGERTLCCRCGSAIYVPKAERCWHCGGYVNVPIVWG
jgi:hypothetical protein